MKASPEDCDYEQTTIATMAWLTRSRASSTSNAQGETSSSASSMHGTPVREGQRVMSQPSRQSSRPGRSVAAPSSPTLSAVSGMTGATRASKVEWGAGIDGPAVIITRYALGLDA